MEGLLPTLAALGLMAAVVLLFRSYIRRPAHVPRLDPPGVRTVRVIPCLTSKRPS